MCRQNHNAGNKTPTAAGPDGTQNASRASAPSPSGPYRCPRTLNMLSPPFLTGPPLSSPILTQPGHHLSIFRDARDRRGTAVN